MKGKFLKVSSLFVATLTTATLVSSPAANALSSKAMDNDPQQNAVKTTTPKIKKGGNLKPLEQREHANVILPNNDRHQITDTTNGHYAPVNLYSS